MIFPFGCYMQVIERWSFRVTHEFPYLQSDEYHEDMHKRKYHLVMNERDEILVLSQIELNQLREFLAGYKEPKEIRGKEI